MAEPLLPPAFAPLEPWCADWALPTTQARHRQRAASSMPELQAFYDALTPRLEDALQHLDGFALDALPAPERRLLDLCLALADVSLAVEKYRTPLLPDARHSTVFEVDTSSLG
jgi:hypothetical protein